jgi:hypothetical protein
MTTYLKKQFVAAMEKGNFELAKKILSSLYRIYNVHGFDTELEAVEFETVVKWFDESIISTKEEVLA